MRSNSFKMRTFQVFIFLFSSALLCQGQDADFSIYNHLVNKTWKAEGTWGDGSAFKQEIVFRYSLDSNIVLAESMGYIDKAQSEFGLRNHGVRQFDPKSKKIKFWEFDVFGGITSGEITTTDNNLFHQYNYGGTLVSEIWEYVNDSTYNFIVGIYDEENKKWGQTFLKTQFRSATPSKKSISASPNLVDKLSGNWTSKAWDGVLNENWKMGTDGHMHQTSEYVENGHILYAASSRIEIIGKELIIFSVIENSVPKIFKATSIQDDMIIFENSDYQYPNKVVYDFRDGGFKRTISGIQKGKASFYTFDFKKVKE